MVIKVLSRCLQEQDHSGFKGKITITYKDGENY